jgi:hypothetical protein
MKGKVNNAEVCHDKGAEIKPFEPDPACTGVGKLPQKPVSPVVFSASEPIGR